MQNKDWYRMGDQIMDLVQKAVESQDFSQLCSSVNEVLDDTVEGIQDAISKSLERRDARYADPQMEKRYQEMKQSSHAAADRIRREMQGREKAKKQELHVVKAPRVLPGQSAGNAMTVCGYGVAAIAGFHALSLLLFGSGMQGVMQQGASFGAILSGVVCAGGIFLGTLGLSKLSRIRRYKHYMELMKGKTYCTVAELAAGSGKDTAFVRKDLKKMLEEGFFPEGHMDLLETCIMTDEATYQQYLQTQKNYDQRVEEEKKAAQEAAKQPALSPECRELMEEGQRYISHIRSCNEKIPDVDMTRKLSRLEKVVSNIFEEVKRRPGIAPELKKMMSYYLPTTQKLLDAYCKLDQQEIPGENIVSTKKEIETTLDTINQAFETLLDSLFEDTAWDISTDISVLRTMLAQEGLTYQQEFAQKQAAAQNPDAQAGAAAASQGIHLEFGSAAAAQNKEMK